MRIVPFLEVCCSAVFLVLLLLQVSAVFLVFSWCQSAWFQQPDNRFENTVFLLFLLLVFFSELFTHHYSICLLAA